MELIISTIAFMIIFFIIIEFIISFSILYTFTKIKKVASISNDLISKVNFCRSTGKPVPISSLDYISKENFSFLPKGMDNHLHLFLKDRITAYLIEEGISSRERSSQIAQKVFDDHWFMSYSYTEISRAVSFIRSLYVPLGALCSILIFSIGFSKIGLGPESLDFNNVTKNLFIISFTMKTAGITLALGVIAFIISSSINFYSYKRRAIKELSEAIFQLKASRINIRIK